MKLFELKNKAMRSESGESILGFQDTGSHACYMIYGVLKPREKRVVKPGRGHEEIVLAVIGDLNVTGDGVTRLEEGCAFHLSGEHECLLENDGDADATYVIAGGHSDTGHH